MALDEFSIATDAFLTGDGPTVVDVRISRDGISIAHRHLIFGRNV